MVTENQTADRSTDTVLTYSVGGTATAGSVFPAPDGIVARNVTRVQACALPIFTDDALVEATESITITGLTKTSGDADITVAGSSASRNILDNDSATVPLTGTTDGNEAGAVSVVFTVTQTAASSTDTVLTYTVGGTATAGSDYTAPSGTVTIPAGSTSATLSTALFRSALVEATESITITGLTKTSGDADITVAGSSASLSIFD